MVDRVELVRDLKARVSSPRRFFALRSPADDVFVFPGLSRYPGVIVVEGCRENVDEFVWRIKVSLCLRGTCELY